MLIVCLGFFLIQLDATIVTVALPAMGQDLGGSLTGLQWVVDSYTLALAALMLTAGPAADRLGARRVFLAGLAVFTAASACCAAAPSVGWLVTARAVQGVGASVLIPASLAMLAHLFPDPQARARALGVWGGVSSAGLAAGPTLGGTLVALLGWRAIFLVNVPVGVLTGWLTHRRLPELPRLRGSRADPAGVLLSILALAGITGGIIEGGQHGWALIGGGLVAGALLIRVQRRPGAMLPPDLFRSRPFAYATCLGLVFNLCLYGGLLCVSLFLQQSRHLSAARTGAMLLPMMLTIGAGAFLSGRLTARFGPRPPMLAGMACGATGAALLSLSGPDALVLAGSVVMGLCSLTMPAMTAVAVSAAGPGRAGLGSGVLNTARQAGGALGVALLGSLPLLHVALAVTACAYIVAIGLAYMATSGTHLESEGTGDRDRLLRVDDRALQTGGQRVHRGQI